MLFKLSLKNMRKSFKDYTIYFLTLILGVAIFYMFNSLDAQQAMLNVSKSTYEIIKLMIEALSIVSVFIAVVLGFLIIYANNFLIKRRKKEFGIYMTLGMGKRQISKILLIETILVGILSLVVGVVIGVFASQLMSVIVAKMFEADMKKFEFVFSSAAMIKTIIYFGIMYVLVMLFNTVSISRYKLIDLITAIKKNEKIKMKNTFVCVIIFLLSIAILGWAYYTVTVNFATLFEKGKILVPIIAGCVGTLLFFWSLSGFILKLIQSNKKIYLKETNMFILRQINAKINTTVISMTIICLMLFVTICVLSSAMSINNSLNKEIKEYTPVDVNIYKDMSKSQSNVRIKQVLEKADYNMNNFKDILEVSTYQTEEVTFADTLGETLQLAKQENSFMVTNSKEQIIKISDYNRIAELYKLEKYNLSDNEYIIVCNYDNMKNIRNRALNMNTKININGKEYAPKYKECKDGFIEISNFASNDGIIVVPDNCNVNKEYHEYFIANYNAETEEEKENLDNELTGEGLYEKLREQGQDSEYLTGMTKNIIRKMSTGLTAMVVFIAMYLGIIFLIASSAILALKELSESSDNKQRYSILRKIGTDEKMIRKTLFIQIGIFFLIPLALAIVHSVFGIQFALKVLDTMNKMDDLIKPIIMTAGVIVLIYGGYFVATYFESKNIIKEE